MIFHLSGVVNICLLASSLTTTKLAFFVIVSKSSSWLDRRVWSKLDYVNYSNTQSRT